MPLLMSVFPLRLAVTGQLRDRPAYSFRAHEAEGEEKLNQKPRGSRR
jgi:hypothetical protein